MKIGLQFAMPAELHALPGAREWTPFETVSGVPVFEAAPGIIACAGGVSKVNAAMAAELLCLRYGVDLILNAGVAGCLTDLPTGSLVVVSDFVQHDVDTTAVGDPIGLVSTVNQVSFPTWKPERCIELLGNLGFSAVTGRAATGDWFAVKGDRAAWIRDTFSPLLAEMERFELSLRFCRTTAFRVRTLQPLGYISLCQLYYYTSNHKKSQALCANLSTKSLSTIYC